jgi:hypothetical protein
MKRDQVTVLPWDDIDVWEGIADIYRHYVVYEKTIHQVIIRRRDGKEVILNEDYPDIKWLGELVQTKILERELPRSLRMFNEGVTVHFGPLRVYPDGIGCCKVILFCGCRSEGVKFPEPPPDGINYEEKILPWPKVADIKLERGRIRIYERGTASIWSQVTAESVPNLCVFLALVNQIFTSQYSSPN